MNAPNQNGPGQNLAMLAEIYALLCDVLTAYFAPPRVSNVAELRQVYSALHTAVEGLLLKPGMEHLRQGCALPLSSLYNLDDGAAAEWEEAHRRRVIESLVTIEQQYYAAGSPRLPEDEKASDLIDEAKKVLKKHKKAQKKALKKSGGILLPRAPVRVREPATDDPVPFTTTKTETRYVVEKERERITWKTIIIGIIIGIITGSVARLIVYFITRYLE